MVGRISSWHTVGTQYPAGIRIPTPTLRSIDFQEKKQNSQQMATNWLLPENHSRWVTWERLHMAGLVKLTTIVYHWQQMETSEKGHNRVYHPKRPSYWLSELAFPWPLSACHSQDCSLHLKVMLQIFHSHSSLSLSHPWLEPFIVCTSQMTWAVSKSCPRQHT